MERYEIVSTISRGHLDLVHLVKLIGSQHSNSYIIKQVALNELVPADREDKIQKARLLIGLQHPYLLAYKETWMEQNILYLVMQRGEGGDLANFIQSREGKHLEEQQILDWFIQISLALRYCHQRKMIHRDLKSPTIFLTRTNSIRLGGSGVTRGLGGTNELVGCLDESSVILASDGTEIPVRDLEASEIPLPCWPLLMDQDGKSQKISRVYHGESEIMYRVSCSGLVGIEDYVVTPDHELCFVWMGGKAEKKLEEEKERYVIHYTTPQLQRRTISYSYREERRAAEVGTRREGQDWGEETEAEEEEEHSPAESAHGQLNLIEFFVGTKAEAEKQSSAAFVALLGTSGASSSPYALSDGDIIKVKASRIAAVSTSLLSLLRPYRLQHRHPLHHHHGHQLGLLSRPNKDGALFATTTTTTFSSCISLTKLIFSSTSPARWVGIVVDDQRHNVVLRDGTITGNTLVYMSPEVCENKPYSYCSDIWSLGCVLYQLCALKHAFDGNDLLEVISKIVFKDCPPIPNIYSDNLKGLLAQMLIKDPEKRPTIDEILNLQFIRDRMQAQIHGKLKLKNMLSGRTAVQSSENNNTSQAPTARVAASSAFTPVSAPFPSPSLSPSPLSSSSSASSTSSLSSSSSSSSSTSSSSSSVPHSSSNRLPSSSSFSSASSSSISSSPRLSLVSSKARWLCTQPNCDFINPSSSSSCGICFQPKAVSQLQPLPGSKFSNSLRPKLNSKKALIIGINEYEIRPLKNSYKDATAMTTMLGSIGFEVTLITDPSSTLLDSLLNSIQQWISSLTEGDLGLFYFSGHGCQAAGKNYLLPRNNSGLSSNLNLNSDWFEENSIDFRSEILNPMQIRNVRGSVILLDCCRANQTFASGHNGLVQLSNQITGNCVIAYACAPGLVADDGLDGDNGLFTKHLLKHLTTPNTHIGLLLIRVTNDVAAESKGKQIPYQGDSSLTEEVILHSVPVPEKISVSVLEIASVDLEYSELIGSGGFGDVYRGKWISRDQSVAIKKLRLGAGMVDEEAKSEFLHELRVHWSLRGSDHILSLYGACMEAGHYALVTELMVGGNLASALKQKQVLSWNEKWGVAIQVIRSINHLHLANPPVIHRDIKPANFLLNEYAKVKVSDFGLSQTRIQTSRRSAEINRTRGGTLRYTAPERLKLGGKYTLAADIYSLGIVLWEIATGEVAYRDDADAVIALAVERGQRLEIPNDVPDAYRQLIQLCWHQDPTLRLTAARALEQAKKGEEDWGQKVAKQTITASS